MSDSDNTYERERASNRLADREVERERAEFRQSRKVHFDWTLNIGHLASLGVCLASVFFAYTSLEKRTTILEEKAAIALQLAHERAVEQKEALKEIKGDLKDMSGSLREIERNMGSKK